MIKNVHEEHFEGLKVDKIVISDSCETLSVRLAKDSTLPNHKTPKDALLFVHFGEIVFKISNKEITLTVGDTYIIPKNIEHSVYANSNAIFLINR